MNKEEFIKLIETLDFEELRCATISYYRKKPNKYCFYDEDCKPKTICIGIDLERTNEIYKIITDLENKIKEK